MSRRQQQVPDELDVDIYFVCELLMHENGEWRDDGEMTYYEYVNYLRNSTSSTSTTNTIS